MKIKRETEALVTIRRNKRIPVKNFLSYPEWYLNDAKMDRSRCDGRTYNEIMKKSRFYPKTPEFGFFLIENESLRLENKKYNNQLSFLKENALLVEYNNLSFGFEMFVFEMNNKLIAMNDKYNETNIELEL